MNTEHKIKFNDLLMRDKTHERDIERKAYFYIIAGYSELYKRVDYIYDFENHCIIDDCIENPKVDFSSSMKGLISLAFNLYNGTNEINLASILGVLDGKLYNIAIEAINIRFSKLSV